MMAQTTVAQAAPIRTRARDFLERIAGHAATASGALFLLLALFMTAEAISRSLGGPLSGLGDQAASLVLSLAGSWAVAHGITTGSHVRIDLLLPLVPQGARRWLHAVAMAALTVFASILAYNTWKLAMASHAIGALIPQSNLELPLAVPQALTAAGLTLFALLAAASVPMQLARDPASGH